MFLYLNMTFWLRPGNLRTSRSEASFLHPLWTRDVSKVFFSHWVRMHYKLNLGRWLLMPLCMVRLLRYDFCIVPWAGMKWVDTLRKGIFSWYLWKKTIITRCALAYNHAYKWYTFWLFFLLWYERSEAKPNCLKG